MTENIEEDYVYIILHKPIDINVSMDTQNILDVIHLSISQIKEHTKDIEFMKLLLHLIIVAQTKYIDEMNEIVESTQFVDTLLQILKGMNKHEYDEQVIITAILCSIGAHDQVKQLAQNEDSSFGEDFIIWAEFNKFIGTENSRRFGFIPVGDAVLNNIPVPGKNFRAITYDEKEGVIRLGWEEVFRWIPSSKEKMQITFELDMRETIPHTAMQIFSESEESPILFVNIPKQLKIYVAHDNLPGTKYEYRIFEYQKPTKKKYDKYY
ncbi:MAG: hypothetical protein EZS28_029759 [Streblomastix strix]|uniref:Uncharacterized protein n=1 Tax=Streblomastix strix TaxID=222440 RepID=A0A5J4UY94_9EUKA|nr:MAG: hypothetical protein EZS28_029759 [Streblomastix strix]